jgi:thiamine kinase-like enzyme
MITRFETGSEPLSVERLRAEPTSLGQAVATLRRFHRSGATLSRRFDPFAALDRQAKAFAAAGRPSPWSARLGAAITRLHAALARSSARPVPIHGDPVPENFLEVGGGMKLIDWEYAGMGDPAWDLAYLAVEAELDEAGADLAAYGDPAPTPGRIAGFRLLAAALSGGWRLLGGGELEPGGAERLAQAETMATSPDLSRWVAALGL